MRTPHITPRTAPDSLGEYERTLLDVMAAHADRHRWVQATPAWAPACPTYRGPADVLTLAAHHAGATRHDMVLAMHRLLQAGLVTPTRRTATEADGAVIGPDGHPTASGPTLVHTGWTINPTPPRGRARDTRTREGAAQ